MKGKAGKQKLQGASLLCAGLALMMAWGIQGKSSMAYFTTYAGAKGGYELRAGIETEIHEEIDGLNKHIRIENTSDGECFVRVKVFAGSVTEISYTCENGNWQEVYPIPELMICISVLWTMGR